MNANPEELNDRFEVFTNQHYITHRTGEGTSANFQELDYIFVKTQEKTTFSFWESIKSLFFLWGQYYSSVISPEQMFKDFDSSQLASDHRPIFATITPQYYKPLWRRCISWLLLKFSSSMT